MVRILFIIGGLVGGVGLGILCMSYVNSGSLASGSIGPILVWLAIGAGFIYSGIDRYKNTGHTIDLNATMVAIGGITLFAFLGFIITIVVFFMAIGSSFSGIG